MATPSVMARSKVRVSGLSGRVRMAGASGAWRVASRSHGGLIIDVSADGTLAVLRLDDGEGETDRFVVSGWRS